MATTITAGNATNGAAISSDSTGILELKSGTGSGTTAMTVSTGQAVTFAQAANLPNTFGFKNRIINGAMVIDQRNAGASVTPSTTVNGFAVDRTQATVSQNSKLTVQQNAGSVTPPAGFTNYLGVTSSSAYSVLTSDYLFLNQTIEGFNIADFAWGTASAATVTLSFWIRSSLTGTHSGSLRNGAANRSYVFTFAISSANTWEQKTITIAGDTSGTWQTGNGAGMFVSFNLGAGSTFATTAGAWGAGNFIGATGSVNVVGTNGATFYITGVQLEKGSTATSFDYRPYGTELQLCQRYYYRIAAGTAGQIFGSGFNQSTTTASVVVPLPVQMRAAPSALEQTGTAADYRVNNLATATTCSSVPVFAVTTANVAYVAFTTGASLVAGQGIAGSCTNTSAFLAWSAEL